MMEWRSYGPDAVLIKFADCLGEETFQRGRAIATDLERQPPPGLVEFVPAFTTVLLEFEPGSNISGSMPALLNRLQRAAIEVIPPSRLHEIEVIYDGPDLERVARLHNLRIADVVRLHSETVYNVYMLGFAPGFPYLGDLDARLHTPRLPSPRTRVPAGSVAVGGEHTGIYSVETPGGWNLIGRISVPLFDLLPEEAHSDDSKMFLLKAGDRVRFIPVDSFRC